MEVIGFPSDFASKLRGRSIAMLGLPPTSDRVPYGTPSRNFALGCACVGLKSQKMGRRRNFRRSRGKPPSEALERDPESLRELVPRKSLRPPDGLHRRKCRRNSFARSLTHLVSVFSTRQRKTCMKNLIVRRLGCIPRRPRHPSLPQPDPRADIAHCRAKGHSPDTIATVPPIGGPVHAATYVGGLAVMHS